MPDAVPMPWRRPLDELRAAQARACGVQAPSGSAADDRLPQAVRCEQAGIRLELAQQGVWIGDVVRLGGTGRPVRGVLELRDGPPYLVVRTGPQDGDFVPVPPDGTLRAEQAWGPPDSLNGDPVARIASNLALSEATARITERLIRSAGHPVEVFYGDSRLVVLQLAARFLARPEYAWKNGLVDQHAVREVSVQMSREGCQFELPGSAQEWFATELIEAYLQLFRPGVVARADLEQTGGLDG